jgi:hypothetical protein
MYLKLFGAVLMSTVLMGGAVSPAYAGGDCAAKVAAYEKEVEADMSLPSQRQASVLSLVQKAKKLANAGKNNGCKKLLKRAKTVAEG